MNNDKIGKFILVLRKEKNLTQKDLADKLFITDRAVSKWERGICLPDITLFEKLAEIFDISVSELLKGEKMKNKKYIEEKEVVKIFSNIETDIKNRNKIVTNTVLVSVTIVLLLFVSYNLLKPIYYTNKTYRAEVHATDKLITTIKEMTNIIKNNQGDYSDEDYKIINKYVNIIELNDIDYDNELYLKKGYTLKEIEERIKSHYARNAMYNFQIYIIPINNIIDKYNNGRYDDINKPLTYDESYYSLLDYIDNFIFDVYQMNSIPSKDFGVKFKLSLWYLYEKYYNSLNSIMKVGNIHE